MIKISAGYSKKVPGEEEYSSNGYHLTIEAEVPDVLMNKPDELKSRISRIFDEAKENVEEQLTNGNNGRNGNTHREEKASDKQKSFIVSLARRRHGMGPEELTGKTLDEISKKEASDLINRLKGGSL